MQLTEEQFESMNPCEEHLDFVDIDSGDSLKSELLKNKIISDHEFNLINFTQDCFGLTKERGDAVLRHIWTAVTADEGMYAAPGFHRVNREYLLITEKPWTDDVDDAVLCEFEEEDDEDDWDDEVEPSSPSALKR